MMEMVWYFAYGSNMNQGDLDAYCRRKNRPLIQLASKSPARCRAEGYELAFHYFSTTREGGAADICPKSGEYVEGVLFDMNEEDMKTISAKEGAPGCYHDVPISVALPNGTKKDATTYVVKEGRTENHFIAPTRKYLDIMISGAKEFGLSPEWIKKLESIPTKD